MQHWTEKDYIISDQCYIHIVASKLTCRTNKLAFCMMRPFSLIS